jgi:tetratricopeptide (TPR) repeat protein
MPRVKKTCFFIAPIGEPASRIRERSDQVYKYVIQPAARECGYKAIRADELPGTQERIISKIFQHLREDPMVVADLTGLNPNVLYELGIRRAFGKPVVHLIQRGHQLPFDVYDIPTVFVTLNVDGVVESRADLIEKIRDAEKETFAKARRIKRAIPRTKPLSPAEIEILGSAYHLKDIGAYKEALERADLLLSHRSDKVEPYLLKGRIYLENLKQYDAAVEQFKKALNVDSSNRAALYDLALTHYHMGNLDDAIKWNQKALDKNPDFVLAIYNHAIYCVAYGKKYNKPEYFNKAEDLYEDVITRDQDYAESAMFNLAALYADFYEKEKDRRIKNQYVKEAISLLDKAIELGGFQRLRKVTGQTPVSYGDSLKKIHHHPAYKKLIAKWKKVLLR